MSGLHLEILSAVETSVEEVRRIISDSDLDDEDRADEIETELNDLIDGIRRSIWVADIEAGRSPSVERWTK